jgi:hypothetical protein
LGNSNSKAITIFIDGTVEIPFLFNTLTKNFTFSRENPSVDKMIAPWLLI